MNSAKERLQKDLAEKLEPCREVLSDADRMCDLEREVERLKQELSTTLEQLGETEISNADWRERFTELTQRIDTVNAGRENEIAQWLGKLTKRNIEIDRLQRAEANAKSFGESWQADAKRWKKEAMEMRKKLESAQEPEALMEYANALVDEYETFCRKCGETWEGAEHDRYVALRRITNTHWFKIVEIITGESHDCKAPYKLWRGKLARLEDGK